MHSNGVAERLAAFEMLPSQELPSGRPIVARLIGRRFEQFFEQSGQAGQSGNGGRFARPFDPGFGKVLVKTLSHLCATLGASFGYAERGELSLFAMSSGGDARRLVSRINGEGSAKLSLLLGEIATFDTRLYSFPDATSAFEYFAWRRKESQVAALDAYCVHVLSATGAEAEAVPRILEGLGPDEKLELLRQNEFDYGRVPAWQREGVGVYVARDGTTGPQLVVDLELPDEDAYTAYLSRLVA